MVGPTMLAMLFELDMSTVLSAQPLWRLSARRQPSAGAAWGLAEPRFPPPRIWLWLHCAAFLYSTTDLRPASDSRTPATSGSLASPRHPLLPWLHETSCPSTGPLPVESRL